MDIKEISKVYQKESILICLSSPQESQKKIERFHSQILYTGIGKVNATLQLVHYLNMKPEQYKLVINFGIAGSANLPVASVVNCVEFIQHDFDVTALNFKKGEVPFDHDKKLSQIISIDSLQHSQLYTGDTFIHNTQSINYDVVDMEGYALAKTCDFYQVDFLCIKFISDQFSVNKKINWKNILSQAAICFADLTQQIFYENK